jgi:hypothetical protein
MTRFDRRRLAEFFDYGTLESNPIFKNVASSMNIVVAQIPGSCPPSLFYNPDIQ